MDSNKRGFFLAGHVTNEKPVGLFTQVAPSEETDVPKVATKVCTPSPEEYKSRCATHLFCRNWCPICVQAKKRNLHTSTMQAME